MLTRPSEHLTWRRLMGMAALALTLALVTAPVAMAAETPQIEIPEARGAAHSRLNRKYFRAMK